MKDMVLLDEQFVEGVAAPDSLWQGFISSRNAHMDDMQTFCATMVIGYTTQESNQIVLICLWKPKISKIGYFCRV